jgi:hypothetical protein
MDKTQAEIMEKLGKIKAACIALKAEDAVLKSLIDGAMPVVEIFKAETPAQEVWKEKWLRQARKIVEKRNRQRQ